jgi:hypothetical protein
VITIRGLFRRRAAQTAGEKTPTAGQESARAAVAQSSAVLALVEQRWPAIRSLTPHRGETSP